MRCPSTVRVGSPRQQVGRGQCVAPIVACGTSLLAEFISHKPTRPPAVETDMSRRATFRVARRGRYARARRPRGRGPRRRPPARADAARHTVVLHVHPVCTHRLRVPVAPMVTVMSAVGSAHDPACIRRGRSHPIPGTGGSLYAALSRAPAATRRALTRSGRTHTCRGSAAYSGYTAGGPIRGQPARAVA